MNELIESWKEEEKVIIEGWKFPHLNGRVFAEDTPWLYMDRAQALLRNADAVLDLDTGGGERLLEMRPSWPAKVVATEGYAPNLKLARERLEPYGVKVVDYWMEQDTLLPFADDAFDLIIIRHSGFNVDELARVLKPGGTFYTQQVHGYHLHDLLAKFDAPVPWPDTASPEHFLPWLESAGFEIVAWQDWTGEIRYLDVGAIVYYLHAVPWMVRGFSVDTHLDYLLKLQAQLEQEGSLVFANKMYMIEAKLPVF